MNFHEKFVLYRKLLFLSGYEYHECSVLYYISKYTFTNHIRHIFKKNSKVPLIRQASQVLGDKSQYKIVLVAMLTFCLIIRKRNHQTFRTFFTATAIDMLTMFCQNHIPSALFFLQKYPCIHAPMWPIAEKFP